MYLGIDPGVNGGLALIDPGGRMLRASKMPATDRDIFEWIPCPPVQAVLERAGASPQMGVVSACTFCLGYGLLRMALTAKGIPFDVVSPVKWQTAMGCRTGGDKNVSKRRAQQLFPGVTVVHAIADALLLAEYCRRVDRGMFALKPEKGLAANAKEGVDFGGEAPPHGR